MENEATSGTSTTPGQAAAALAELRSGHAAVASRLGTPPWYHPLVGLVLFVLLGALALPQPARTVAVLLALVAEAMLLSLYARLTGLWVNALKIPETRTATTATVVLALGSLAVAAAAREAFDAPAAFLVAGLVTAVAYVLLWRWVERVLPGRLRSRP